MKHIELVYKFSGLSSLSWGTWLFNTFLIYLVNFVILGGCLIKLLVYGDSVPKSQSKEAGLFYKHKRLADNYLKKVNYFFFYNLKGNLEYIILWV